MRELFKDQYGQEYEKPDDRVVEQRTSVRGVCIQDGRVLVIKPQNSEKWEVPGGRVEDGEDHFKAINREFEEETGYSVQDIEQSPLLVIRNNFFDSENDTYYDSQIFFYGVNSLGNKDEGRIIDNGESIVREWVLLESLDSDNCRPLSLEAIEKSVKMRSD